MLTPRSTFVTVVGWLFTALAGCLALMSLLQTVIFAAVSISDPQFQEKMSGLSARGMPPYAVYIYQHLAGYAFVIFLVSCVTLVAAIGLLRRADWARRLFIAIMVLGIICTVLTPIALADMMLSMANHSAIGLHRAPPSHDNVAVVFFVVFIGVNAIVALGAVCLYDWIIKRLVSPGIRREFGVA